MTAIHKTTRKWLKGHALIMLALYRTFDQNLNRKINRQNTLTEIRGIAICKQYQNSIFRTTCFKCPHCPVQCFSMQILWKS